MQSSTITYGEVRRRELFHAMLVAWVLGLGSDVALVESRAGLDRPMIGHERSGEGS